LHFHVTDEPFVLGSDSVPYVFEDFEVVGEVKDFAKLFKSDHNPLPGEIGDSAYNGKRTNELPKEGAIVVFPKP